MGEKELEVLGRKLIQRQNIFAFKITIDLVRGIIGHKKTELGA
jgi:hypothetical protein